MCMCVCVLGVCVYGGDREKETGYTSLFSGVKFFFIVFTFFFFFLSKSFPGI